MTIQIDNTQDYLDVRDIIAHFEELETELQDAHEGIEETPKLSFDAWLSDVSNDDSHTLQDAATEFLTLRSLLDDMKGNGGDEQWKGDWYPLSLIRDSYFETAMDDLLEDIGDLPKNLPCYLKIEVDYDALQRDYTSVEYDGVTYWYR